MIRTRTMLAVLAALVSQTGIASVAAAQGTPADSQAPAAQPAETAPPAAEAAPDRPRRKRAGEEEIVVTGSRIRRKDLTTPAPISVISKQEMQASGKVSIGDFLQSLPEQGNAINTSFNNGGNGATRISLRSLGTARTLVLLNGRRFVPGGTGADASVDLNSIPTGIIERIEVLKDGASAVYGSDAIAGVVNLITRKRMDGVDLSGYAGTASRGDGTTYDLNATAGTTGERGSLLFSGGYYTQKSVFAGDRAFSRIPYAYVVGSDGVGRTISQGSPTTIFTTVDIPSCGPGKPAACAGVTLANASPLYNQLMQRYGSSATTYIFDPSAPLGWRPFGSLELPPAGDGFNFQPDNYLVTPQTRVSLYSIGEARLGANARGYFEGSYVNRQSDQALAAEPLNTDGEALLISASNIYNPFGRDFSSVDRCSGPFCSSALHRRLQEFGKRRTAQDIDTFRIVAGVDGTLPEEAGPLKSWFWDFSFNYGRTEGTTVKQGNLKRSGLSAALGPSFRDPDGTPHCGTPGNIINNCVPLNLFGQPGDPNNSITPDMITNLTFTGNQRGTNQMVSGQFNTSGELFKLLSERPVGLAAGYEYRIVAGESIPDPITVAGDTTGNKGDITRGHYYVNEGYGELSIPLLSDLPFVQDLEGTAAIRVFNYSTFGTDNTYKFGGRWRVIRDFTLRGTYSTGFRAPSVGDLFSGQSDSFPATQDPCAPASAASTGPTGRSQSCGAAAGNGFSNPQLRTRIGGNPNLKPETAKIYTAGIVLEPSFVRNFTFTADYYHITVTQSIGPIGAGTILTQCYPTNDQIAQGKQPNQAFCNLITRDTGNQFITNIINTQQNVGQDATAGIDLALNYSLPTEFGRFGAIIDATWLGFFDRTLADGTLIRARGSYDLAFLPAWKAIGGLRYGLESFAGGVNVHFSGSFRECGTSSGAFAGSGRCYANSTFSRDVGAYASFDLFASYTLPKFLGRATIAAGVNNIFDKQPLFVYNAGNTTGTSDPTAYDYIGRFFYARVGYGF